MLSWSDSMVIFFIPPLFRLFLFTEHRSLLYKKKKKNSSSEKKKINNKEAAKCNNYSGQYFKRTITAKDVQRLFF